jgi:cytochrome c oxidase assembly factor CtaG
LIFWSNSPNFFDQKIKTIALLLQWFFIFTTIINNHPNDEENMKKWIKWILAGVAAVGAVVAGIILKKKKGA